MSKAALLCARIGSRATSACLEQVLAYSSHQFTKGSALLLRTLDL